MARYGEAFRNRTVARLLPPESADAGALAKEIGVSVKTLERWLAAGSKANWVKRCTRCRAGGRDTICAGCLGRARGWDFLNPYFRTTMARPATGTTTIRRYPINIAEAATPPMIGSIGVR